LNRAFAAGLKDNNVLVRQASVEGLGELGPKAAVLLPELQELIDDPSPQVRTAVVDTLSILNSPDAMRMVLSRSDKQLRSQAIQELDRRHRSDTIPVLTSALEDSSRTNSAEAAAALGNLGRQALPAIGSLEQAALNSPDRETRLAAIHALRQIGSEGLPTIQKVLSDADVRVRDYAIAVLGSYGRGAGVPALAAFLDQAWTPSTTKAAEVLETLGPEGLPALKALEHTAAKSPDRPTRLLAVRALARIGPQGYPSVTKLLGNPDPEVRAEAQSAVKSMWARYPWLRKP
jgi:HEAT repeat protein